MTAKQQESLIAKLQEEIASLRERATIAEKKLEEQAIMETARQSMLSAAQLQESLSRGDATSRSKGRGEALPAQVLGLYSLGWFPVDLVICVLLGCHVPADRVAPLCCQPAWRGKQIA